MLLGLPPALRTGFEGGPPFYLPLLSTILSAPVLGEIITPLQAVGGAIMLGPIFTVQRSAP